MDPIAAAAENAARRITPVRAHRLRIGNAADELRRLEGEQHYLGASCVVEWAPPLPDRARWVRNVQTAPERRRQGDATALLQRIAAQADALGYALVLEPRPADDSIDAQSLERWYRGLGFVTLQRDPAFLLVRAPRAD